MYDKRDGKHGVRFGVESTRFCNNENISETINLLLCNMHAIVCVHAWVIIKGLHVIW